MPPPPPLHTHTTSPLIKVVFLALMLSSGRPCRAGAPNEFAMLKALVALGAAALARGMPLTHLNGLDGRFSERHALLAAGGGSRAEEHFYKGALLDHFGAADLVSAAEQRTWAQRYFVDFSYWKEGGPVFLYVGGEGPLAAPTDRLFMVELAEKYGALVLALEHRFYGESQPTEDMSVGNLAYLTSQQALADLAHFVDYINSIPAGASCAGSEPPLDMPFSARGSAWVTFGGSYPGNLSGWARLKYPGLVAGAIASSAPVLAEFDFVQYAQVVGRAMSNAAIGGSQACFDRVANATKVVHEVVAPRVGAAASDWSMLPASLRPCGAVGDALDLATFETGIFSAWQGVVQYNLEGRGPTVEDLCGAVTAAPDALQGLADAVALVVPDECLASSFEDDLVAPLADEAFSGPDCGQDCSAMRQWIWQSCNEFGYFQVTTGEAHPFTAFAVDAANSGVAICEAAYGIAKGARYGAMTGRSNYMYGARAPGSTGVTFVNGDMDPWMSLGIVPETDPFHDSCNSREDLGEDAVCAAQDAGEMNKVVLVAGGAHCADMYAKLDTTPAIQDSLAAAHAAIEDSVREYIGVE